MSVGFLREQLADANVAFIYDEAVGSQWGYGLLRSLPAIHYLSVNHFTFPKQWRQLSGVPQYDYLSYQYELLGKIELEDSNLCAITDQYYEDDTPFSLRPLLNRYLHREETFVVVADTRDFDPQEGQRPLHMQNFVDVAWDYRRVYQDFQDYYRDIGVGCPLRDTDNLFMHDMANLHRMVTGTELSRSQSLFNILPEAPYLPLYDVMVSIFSRENEPGAAPLDSYDEIEALGRWIRRRIDISRKDALGIARDLNRRVDSNESVFDATQRFRHPAMSQAETTATSIDAETSSVHERYKQWLQERTA
jgi:hypothetical protein